MQDKELPKNMGKKIACKLLLIINTSNPYNYVIRIFPRRKKLFFEKGQFFWQRSPIFRTARSYPTRSAMKYIQDGAMKASGGLHLFNRGCRTEWHPRIERLSLDRATGSRYLAYVRGIVFQTRDRGIGGVPSTSRFARCTRFLTASPRL